MFGIKSMKRQRQQLYAEAKLAQQQAKLQRGQCEYLLKQQLSTPTALGGSFALGLASGTLPRLSPRLFSQLLPLLISRIFTAESMDE